MTKTLTVGIIGAGICGLMAARELRQSGFAVWLLEQSPEVGGRMATQQIDEGVFDYGAQFFTGRNPEFCDLVEQMQNAHLAREWFRGYPSQAICKDENYPRFCGFSGMTDVPKFLAQGLDVHFNTTVQSIDWTNDKWCIKTNRMIHEADALICTPPVPQSLKSFQGNDMLPDAARHALEKITYEPCWAVMAQLEGPSQIPAPGALHFERGPLSWIADNYQKGISPQPGSITLHANGSWTQEHFEAQPETIIALLLEAARDYLDSPAKSAQAHLWHYAKPLVTHPAPCLILEQPAPLVFAGDAFISSGAGPRVEGAALSGLVAVRSLCNLYNK